MADYDNSRHIFENCHSLNPMCLSAFQEILWQYGNSFHRHRSHLLGGIIYPPPPLAPPGGVVAYINHPPGKEEDGYGYQGGGGHPCETTISGVPSQMDCSKYQLFIFSYRE